MAVAHRTRGGLGGLRRWAGFAIVALLLTVLLELVPGTRWAVAEELDVRTESLRLPRRAADRAGEAVALTGLGAQEVQERRGALASRDRRTSGVRKAEVRALGVTLEGQPPTGPVLVRARVDGSWTPWLEVPFAEGEGPDRSGEGRPGVHSEPVWLGEADAYELDAPASIATLEVHAVRPVGTIRTPVPSGVAGAATEPTIRSRASWGARPPREHPSTTQDLKLAIVHHTVSGNTYSRSQVPAVLRSIQAYHQDARGYNDIAYNVLVDRFGVAWEGRAGGLRNVVLGGHSQGFNTGAVGVSVIGDYRTAGVSSAIFETVARVVAWKLAIHNVNPRSTVPYTSAGSARYASGTTVTLPRVVGHRDVQSTDCPGGNLYRRLPALRTRVNELVPLYQQGRLPMVLDLDGTGDGLTDPFEYRPGAGADVQWRAQASGTFARTSKRIAGTYRPATGDFDGDGRDDIFWHGTGSAPDHIYWSNGNGSYTVESRSVNGSYVPVVGDFDGSGSDDVLWYGTGLAADQLWRWTGRTARGRAVRQDLSTGIPLVGDFDGDGRDDIFWYAPGPDADDEMWWSDGSTFQVWRRPVDGWYLPVVHDADGDGRDDITWFAPGGTTSHRWRFSTARARASTAFTHTAIVALPHTGDFDGDGRSDLLLYGSGDRRDAVWYSTPAGVVERSVTIKGSWTIVTGPMDGATLPLGSPDDVLFVHTGTDVFWRGQITRTFGSTLVG